MSFEQPVVVNASVRMQDAYMRMILAGLSGIAGIVTMPIEMWLRPWFGTTYFHPITGGLAWIGIQLLAALAVIGRPAHSHAPIGMGVLVMLFWFTWLAHSPRIWRRIHNMDLEDDSDDEGEALPIFRPLPYYGWGSTRIVYEPLLVALSGALLAGVGLAEPSVGLYLLIVAFALLLKNIIRWYDVFRMLRELRNIRFRAQLLQQTMTGRALQTTIAPPVMVATGVPSAVIAKMAVDIAGLSPEDAALLSTRDTHLPNVPVH